MDIAVLHEMGLVASYHDYLDLPQSVIDHAMMLADARARKAKNEEDRARRGKRR